MKAAEKWVARGAPAFDAVPAAAAGRAEVVHRRRPEAAGQGRHPGQRRLRDHQDPRVRIQDPGPGVRGDHRHQGQARPHPGRRRGREAADVHAVGAVHLRRLDLRFGPDRHPLPLRGHPAPVRLHGRGGQGVHQPDAGSERLHRHQVHHRPRQEAVPVARPAVRQPVLVPGGLVCAQGPAGTLQGRSTATSWASPSTGRRTRTSRTSSPTR